MSIKWYRIVTPELGRLEHALVVCGVGKRVGKRFEIVDDKGEPIISAHRKYVEEIPKTEVAQMIISHRQWAKQPTN